MKVNWAQFFLSVLKWRMLWQEEEATDFPTSKRRDFSVVTFITESISKRLNIKKRILGSDSTHSGFCVTSFPFTSVNSAKDYFYIRIRVIVHVMGVG